MPVCCHPTCYTIVAPEIICCPDHWKSLPDETRRRLFALRLDRQQGRITEDEELDRQEAVVQEHYRRAAS